MLGAELRTLPVLSHLITRLFEEFLGFSEGTDSLCRLFNKNVFSKKCSDDNVSLATNLGDDTQYLPHAEEISLVDFG